MIVVMDEGVDEAAVEAVIARLVGAGCDVHRSSGATRTILGVVGDVSENERAVLGELRGVSQVVRVSTPYRRASRRFREQPTVVEGDFGRIGGGRPWIAVEPVGLAPTGGDAEPPSLPYAFASGRPFDAAVSRLREPPEQIGALACLALHPRARSRSPLTFVPRKPVWDTDAWLGAAERALDGGGSQVVLLEAGGCPVVGPRTFDVVALAQARRATHLPIVVDVPVVAARAAAVEAVACAGVAAGAEGVILRVDFGDASRAPSLPASLPWDAAAALAERLRAIGEALRG